MKDSCSRSGDEEEIRLKPLSDQITPLIQRKDSAAAPGITAGVASGVSSLQGGGRPMSQGERSFFEPRFGTDFSGVRVHADNSAAKLSKSINARAFTLGRNIVFGAEQYKPYSGEGKRLMAHELTHVVQQGLRWESGPVIQCQTPQSTVSEEGTSGLGFGLPALRLDPDIQREIQRLRWLRQLTNTPASPQTATPPAIAPEPGQSALLNPFFGSFSNLGMNQIDWLSIRNELIFRGVTLDERLAGDIVPVWQTNYQFFGRVLGLNNDSAAFWTNKTIARAVGSGLSRDHPTMLEQTDRELGTSSTILPVSDAILFLLDQL
ncbi:MAG: DUF4157 domain-containing protein [Deltaproteobacteria bacterium]|nr:DUF4157 domain-containing protein [Deltaproteobacteria bacterium]